MSTLPIFCTYTNEHDEVFCLDQGQCLPDNWSDYVWQYSESVTTARAAHFDKIDEWQKDPTKFAY